MQPQTDNLAVRQHARHKCDLASLIAVVPAHAESVRFNPSAVDQAGHVRASVQDVSLGGVGLHTSVFIPKRTCVAVTITVAPGEAPIVLQLRIARVIMLDRQPRYYLGTSLANQEDPASLKALELLISAAQRAHAEGTDARA